jgi:CRISPR-associated endoribonuclease Cas6
MRIKLTLSPADNCIIPINYQYPLSCAIYKILSGSSAEYAEWLHEKGYIDKAGKPRKLFTFSNLDIFPRAYLLRDALKISLQSKVIIFVSSPMLEDFIQNFVQGIFLNQTIEIGSQRTVGRFIIERVESLASPEFSESMSYRCLSPILLSTMKEYNGKLSQYYLRPDDELIEETVKNNLLRKYELIYNEKIDCKTFKFSLDKDYIYRKGGANHITKLITLNKDKEAIKVKTFVAPFVLETSPELQKLAYECGIGEKNSQGLGMVEVEKKD